MRFVEVVEYKYLYLYLIYLCVICSVFVEAFSRKLTCLLMGISLIRHVCLPSIQSALSHFPFSYTYDRCSWVITLVYSSYLFSLSGM